MADDSNEPMYELHDGDAALLKVAQRILANAMQLPTASWAQKASIAKMLHVISRLPAPSCSSNLSVGFTGARTEYGDAVIYFHLTVAVDGQTISINYGGHYYHPSSGGDSFTVFRWTADPEYPAELSDFRASLGVVLALVDPMRILGAMYEELNAYELELVDEDNPMLDDSPAAEDREETLAGARAANVGDDDDDVAGAAIEEEEPEDQGEDEMPLVVNPITPEDGVLLSRIDRKLYKSSAGRAYGIDACDGCDFELARGGLFVDGSSGAAGWGNYCSACALRYGVQVGWGKGQLYAKQPSGTWEGVAGFRR